MHSMQQNFQIAFVGVEEKTRGANYFIIIHYKRYTILSYIQKSFSDTKSLDVILIFLSFISP